MLNKIVGALIVVLMLISFSNYFSSSVHAIQSPSADQTVINVSGAFALYPLMVTWAQEYESINPSVTIQVSAGGAGKGMSDVLAGLVDIGMVSRTVTQTELNFGAYPIDVAKGGVVAVVNANNPVLTSLLTDGVTKSILQGIFIYGNITTWGAAIRNPLSPVNKIDVYTRSDSSGTADTWAKFLGKSQDDLQGVGVYGDPGMIQAITNDPIGIGFNGISWAYDNVTGKQTSGIVVVPIDFNNNGRIDPNENFYGTRDAFANAIATGVYPTPPAQDLYLVTKGKPTGATRSFMQWILTDGQKFVPENGFINLPNATLTQELSQF